MAPTLPEADHPVIVHDPARLAALASYRILDTPPEQGFDDIVQLARQLCGAPVALVSLVADDRQWFKARDGFPLCETNLNSSVCAHALSEPDLLVIGNLAADPRTTYNPLVMGPPYIQFYAGAPLRMADGQTLGTLCVIDHRPRPEGLSEVRREALRALARQVVTQLELRRASADNQRAAERREAILATQHAVAHARGDLDTILAAIAAGTMRTLPQADGAVVLLREGDELVYQAPAGSIASWHGLRVPVDGSLTGACVRTGEAILCADAPADTRVMQAMVESLTLRSCVLAPVVRGGQTVGVLKVQSDAPDAFTETDLKMVQVLAASATTALADAALRDTQRFTAALLELGDRLRDLSDIGAMALAAAGIVGRTLDASRVAFGLVDAEAGTVTVEPDWVAAGQASIAGPHRFTDYGDFLGELLRGVPVVVRDAASDPRTADDLARWQAIGVVSLVNIPVRERGQTVGIYLVHDSKPRHWRDPELAFLQAVADRVDVGVARVRAEEHQHLLNRELSHRMKNLLAMVQAIATQTMRTAPDVATVKTVLSGRLVALGRAHDLLMGGALTSTAMEPVVRAALASHSDHVDRFAITGPAITIGTDQALSLALMLHELATNAAKYGALSTAVGQIDIAWSIDPAEGGALLTFSWVEVGGPPVTPPQRSGFGTRFIQRGLAAQVDGTLDLSYPVTGLTCRLTATLEAFQRGN